MRIMVAKKIVIDSMPILTTNPTRYLRMPSLLIVSTGKRRRMIKAIVLGYRSGV